MNLETIGLDNILKITKLVWDMRMLFVCQWAIKQTKLIFMYKHENHLTLITSNYHMYL